MNNLCYNEVQEFVEEKLKLLESIMLWKNTESVKSEYINADVTELSIIAQLMGYKLESFQTVAHLQNIKEEVKIEMTCLKSGVRSVLYKPRDTCSCPSDDVLEKGQFWNVVGVGPSSSNSSQTSINSSTSSLLPKLSNTTKLIIKGLLKKISELISAEVVKDAEPTGQPLFARHNSLNLANRKEHAQRIKRTSSFEITSNFIQNPNPCTSTPDTGLSNGKRFECAKCNILNKNLINIHKIVNESLHVASPEEMNRTFTTSKLNITPRISDIKPTEGPSVKHIKEIQVKTEVKKEIPKFRTVVRKCDTPTVNFENPYRTNFNSATKVAAKTTGIARMLKMGKATDVPANRLCKRKL